MGSIRPRPAIRAEGVASYMYEVRIKIGKRVGKKKGGSLATM
jgi:hypothetical protein